MTLHGKVINYKDIKKYIPVREKFLDKELFNKITSKINNDNELLFMPCSTHEMNMQQAEYKKSKYKLILFGIFEDGRRGTICINNIQPYFEIKLKTNKDLEQVAQDLFDDIYMEGEADFAKFNKATNNNGKMPTFGFKIEPAKFELCAGKPLHVFQEYESNYVKIYFDKLEHRKNAINYIRALGYETSHDDLNSYYRVVSRDYLIPLAQWLIINDYSIDESEKYLKGNVFHVDIYNIDVYKGELSKHLLKDNMISMAFDIETYNKNEDGEIPLPQFPQHVMFMISMTFQFFHASTQLLNVCLVDVQSAPNPDFLTIICENEQNLIRGFAQIFNKLQPEIVMGFNSDNYDWPWIIERAQSYKGLLAEVVELFDFTIQKDRTDQKAIYSYKKNSTKIEATTNVDGKNLQTPGFIPIDVCTCFRQLYSTSEQWSLNFFLSKNKLGGKEDMPYQEMFQIYKDISSEVSQKLLDKMSLVGKYCVVDSIRCHDLISIRNIIQDKREVANISYTTLFDSFYRANGMKVRNLVIANGTLRNLKISNIAHTNAEDGKYPGAFVIPPTKGLNVSKLSIQERIEKAKLGYEEYKEWLSVTDKEVQEYKNIITTNGPIVNLEELEPQTPNHLRKMLAENTGRPITGLDFSSLYPSLMMAYNLSPEYMIIDLNHAKEVNKSIENGEKKHNLYKIKFEFNNRYIRGWSVRHDNKLDPANPNFKFGLFPTILKSLFDDRKKLKNGPNGLNYYEHEKERLLGLSKEEFNTKENQELYEDVCFRYNSIDSKQRGLKVMMNTFYGESGNKRSPLFMLAVAGGITTAGVYNIKMVNSYVQEQGCKVYYGDSVPADTPILIRYTSGNIDIVTIDNVPGGEWFGYPQFKPAEVKPVRINKQQHIPLIGLETWTSKGWASIKRVIRHKTNKRMFRINTHTGVIDVTEDHSLLTSSKIELKPIDAKIGDELFHSFPEEFPENNVLSIDCVLNSPFSIRKAYWDKIATNEACSKSKIIIQKLYYLAKSIGYKYISCVLQEDIYWLRINKKFTNNPTIKKIIELPPVTQDEFVYDIETETGDFQGGVGNMIVTNTDSLYLAMPEQEFKQLDIDYYTERISKLEYWEQMVQITFEKIKILNKAVNQLLLDDNRTSFLKMAYEEILFPSAFLAKKKYFGIPHLSKANFTRYVMFIRGLALKTRGVSNVLIEVCDDILKTAVTHTNILTIMEIVQNKIDEFYGSDWTLPEKLSAFVMTGVYKPTKQNVKMHTFHDRMLHEKNITIMPNERIKYVIVKKYPYKFDMRGRKTELSVGDKMELMDVAIAENLSIDIDYYMEKTINGQLARFVTYHEDFQAPFVGVNYDEADEIKKAEDMNLKLARKYIDNLCKKYHTNYSNKGDIYKSVFKKSSTIVKNKIIEKCGDNESSNVIIKLLGFSVDPDDNLEDWIFNRIKTLVEKKNKSHGETYINNLLKEKNLKKDDKAKYINELQNVYYVNKTSILNMSENQYNDRQQILESRFKQSINMIKNTYHMNSNIIEEVSKHIKTVIDIDNKFDNVETLDNYLISLNIDADELDQTLDEIATNTIQNKASQLLEGINELKYIYCNLMGNYEYIYNIRNIADYLKTLRNRKVNNIKPIPKSEVKNLIKSLVSESINDNLQF
jgi:DNA polymerase elongation subunit (family B)